MAIQDISWGAVIAGAGIAVALAASVPITTAAAGAAATAAGAGTLIGALTNAGMSSALAFGSTAVVGGIVGEFTSDLFKRTRDACNTLLQK